jgi:hypothetical protein
MKTQIIGTAGSRLSRIMDDAVRSKEKRLRPPQCFTPNYWYFSEFAVSFAAQCDVGRAIVAVWRSWASHAAAALVVGHLPR